MEVLGRRSEAGFSEKGKGRLEGMAAVEAHPSASPGFKYMFFEWA